MLKKLFFVLIAVTGLSATVANAAPASTFRVFFPRLALAVEDGERVTELKLTQTCGEFWGLAGIPKDWGVEIVSPSSCTASLHASAGHGASSQWNGVVQISGTHARCKDLNAVITTETVERRKEYYFSGRELQLRK
ncbi:hypothetical protein [Undibacterium sp.]|uniref:hypothetical protein n=1 Tax=Undibacterium sp. TaxID=1914977 RepID=UPI002731E6FE|nr:hypothetical protein [Undibacterium sp.]MDP1980207.1 hypothetical protein [Undibacterium sp.]